jgi:hypothetical protein
VESTGMGYPEFTQEGSPPCHFTKTIKRNNGRTMNRLNVITTTLEPSASSSLLEAQSILAAVDAMRKTEEYDNAKYILKVTGRYFLENVEDVINSKLTRGFDFYVQNHRFSNLKWQNSEYFGARKESIEALARNVVSTVGFMEAELYKASEPNFTVFKDGFPNDSPRGGDKMIIDPL